MCVYCVFSAKINMPKPSNSNYEVTDDPVCTAVIKGDLAKVKTLVKEGHNLNVKSGAWYKRTPLLWAANRVKRNEILETLY